MTTGICPGCGHSVRRLGGKGRSAYVAHARKLGIRCLQRTPGGGPVTGEESYRWNGEVGVVEPFASVLAKAGKQYANHGGLLRVVSDEDDQLHELHAGDYLIVGVHGHIRVHKPSA